MTKSVTSIGISIPTDMLKDIDEKRGDVTRSRFILRILEKHYNMKNDEKPREER